MCCALPVQFNLPQVWKNRDVQTSSHKISMTSGNSKPSRSSQRSRWTGYARLCRRVIKGRQQGVLPPPVYHKCSPSTMHKPFRKGGNFYDLYGRIQRAYRVRLPRFCKVVIRNAMYNAARQNRHALFTVFAGSSL